MASTDIPHPPNAKRAFGVDSRSKGTCSDFGAKMNVNETQHSKLNPFIKLTLLLIPLNPIYVAKFFIPVF